jgi:putative MFS transporter
VNRPDDIAARLDRLPVTRLHLLVALLCGFGLFVDVAELALNGALSVVFSAPPHALPPAQLGVLIGSVFLGGAIGAPLFGILADRAGRRLALQVSLVLLALPSLLAGLSDTDAGLIAYRFLSGMALGAYPPLMTAFLADILPPRRRGTVILAADALGLLGWPAVILFVHLMTPFSPLGLEGWRWSLVGGAILAAIGAVLFSLVPESPRWLAVAGRADEAEAACRRFEQSAARRRDAGATAAAPPFAATAAAPPFAATAAAPPSAATRPAVEPGAEAATTAPFLALSVAHPSSVLAPSQGPPGAAAYTPAYWRRVALLAAVYLLRAWATLGFPLVSGAILLAKGWDVRSSLLFIGLAGFGAATGALLASSFADRLERRTALTLCSVALVASALAFAIAEAAVPLVAAAAAFNLVGAMYGPILSVYATELFPTVARTTATATAWSANRIGSGLAPLALLPLLHAAGTLAVLATIAAALTANLVLILAFGPRGLSGRPLSER